MSPFRRGVVATTKNGEVSTQKNGWISDALCGNVYKRWYQIITESQSEWWAIERMIRSAFGKNCQISITTNAQCFNSIRVAILKIFNVYSLSTYKCLKLFWRYKCVRKCATKFIDLFLVNIAWDKGAQRITKVITNNSMFFIIGVNTKTFFVFVWSLWIVKWNVFSSSITILIF